MDPLTTVEHGILADERLYLTVSRGAWGGVPGFLTLLNLRRLVGCAEARDDWDTKGTTPFMHSKRPGVLAPTAVRRF